ncbi:sulfite oxidase [Actinopolyspora mzabensis]|uniref:Sulfite oxidase n=2 Tax=Actinopolyspora mzabensis TaxID=995066 RepID=A0A1G9A0H3_ACTMZ|nr:sulfite oxidase [Actinopolyspora mzabensis]
MLWGKREDMIVHAVEPLNVEPPRAALAASIVTDTGTFFVRNHGPVPEVEPREWRLRVQGEVEHSLELSLPELRSRFPVREMVATIQCAGNRRDGLMRVRDIPGELPWGAGAVSTATWTGVRLRDVLAAAAPTAHAEHVEFEARDVSRIASPPQRFGGSVPMVKAQGDEVLLAWEMNGEPLPAVHGAPLRVVVPGYIGARSVKWVDRITVSPRPSDNFFHTTAYRLLPAEADPGIPGHEMGFSLGPLAVNSDVLVPPEDEMLRAGPKTIRGYALAGEAHGITRVDVSTDEGRNWTQVTMEKQAAHWAWRHWHLTLDLPPGRIPINARAWDTSATVQPETPIQLWNPKGYMNNAWAHRVLWVRR